MALFLLRNELAACYVLVTDGRCLFLKVVMLIVHGTCTECCISTDRQVLEELKGSGAEDKSTSGHVIIVMNIQCTSSRNEPLALQDSQL